MLIKVIKWLEMDEEDRPSFLTMYFEEPDVAMHANGPDSDGLFNFFDSSTYHYNYLFIYEKIGNYIVANPINLI